MALDPWRCQSCGRRLADVALSAGSTVACKCHACKALNIIRAVEPRRPDGPGAADLRAPTPLRRPTVG